MDSKTVRRVRSIDFEMGHLRGYIHRLEKGSSVYHITEEFQNILDKETLTRIRDEANSKVLAILKQDLAKLQNELDEL